MGMNRRLLALIAGVSLLTMAVLAGYANFGVLVPLVDRQDALSTGRAMVGALDQAKASVWMLASVAALDVLAAWALWLFFRPGSPRVSALAAAARVVYAALFLAVIVKLKAAVDLYDAVKSGRQGDADAFADALALVNQFFDGWALALILFGLHLLLLGLAAARAPAVSKVMGRIVAVLLAVAGLGYVVDGLRVVVRPAWSFSLSSVTFVGEVVLMGWLLWLAARPSGRTHVG
ncbi:DUF4386 family protein [Azospirillum sp. sgz302134]